MEKKMIGSQFHAQLLEVQTIFEGTFLGINLLIIGRLNIADTYVLYWVELELRINRQ